MTRFLLHLARAGGATLFARARGRRLRPTWSLGFEVIARAMKANAARISRLDWPAQRAEWTRAVQPSPVLQQVRIEDGTCGEVPGLWFVARTAADSAPALLYFHGGSFIYGSARDTHRELLARHAIASGCRVFAPEYRLAPEHPFPAAVDDALAAYRGLLASGTPPARVAIAGDSAGGNLALVTMLRARDAGEPLPAAAVLVSPYLDQTERGGSMIENARFDWAELRDFDRWTETYLAGHDPRDPLASPAFADPRGLPPLLIQVGGAEMLHDQVTAFAARARAAGVRVELSVYPDMIHNWHALASMFRIGQDAIDELGAFVRRHVR